MGRHRHCTMNVRGLKSSGVYRKGRHRLSSGSGWTGCLHTIQFYTADSAHGMQMLLQSRIGSQRLWVWRVPAASGTPLVVFSHPASCGLRDWHGTTPVLCSTPVGDWALCPNPFGALRGSWVMLAPARMDTGCPLCHFPRWELFQNAVSRGTVWAMQF